MDNLTCLRWRRNLTVSHGYWDDTAISGYAKLLSSSSSSPPPSSSFDDRTHGASSDNDTIVEISYNNLHILVAMLARRIHAMISERLAMDQSHFHLLDQRLSVPIGVAIPEGFFLPLSVAALHALCDGSKYSTVIVPIDPTEGTERLKRILADAKPLIVFVAAHCDLEKMRQIVAPTPCEEEESSHEQKGELYHVFDKAQPLYQAHCPWVIDLRDVVQSITTTPAQIQSPLSEHEATNQQRKRKQNNTFRSRIHERERTMIPSVFESCFSTTRNPNCISHIVYTSGTTGFPKGCVASINALDSYVLEKNRNHAISSDSTILLASAVSFDPCISDIIATFHAGATLYLTTREDLSAGLYECLHRGKISHVLCTPTLWSTMSIHNASPIDLPHLQVVALGGERIPQQTIRAWARRKSNHWDNTPNRCRLFATYGVTEACVYQTMGEIFCDDPVHVGVPFQGMKALICKENRPDTIVIEDQSETGEIVLVGQQLDEYAGYLRRPELTASKFHYRHDLGGFLYRTGDRGAIRDGRLQVFGRTDGDAMIKYNGIRVELGEVEAAIIDSDSIVEPAVVDCMVILTEGENELAKCLCAYVVFSKPFLVEMGITREVPNAGTICKGNVLALLMQRCKQRSRVTPSTFLLIPRIPLTRTGKRNKDAAPRLANAVPLQNIVESSTTESEIQLSECSTLGALVATQLIDCLNLLPCQLDLVTTSATFAMLGGDSLAATRVVRALYAHHHQVFNSRQLGGAYGVLEDEIFSVKHLLRAPNLGSYVDFLQSNKVCQQQPANNILLSRASFSKHETETNDSDPRDDDRYFYDLLLQSIMQDNIILALALVESGSPPNLVGNRKHRISNTRGLQERKVVFHSTPLHLACLKGVPQLVRALLANHAVYNIPDASGKFPIHLAASGQATGDEYNEDEDFRRLECVKMLLEAGNPLPMKDGNNHTVIHSAARSGCKRLLAFFMERWKEDFIATDPVKYKGSLDWLDRWSRSPVHWAVVNGRVDTLTVLLENGCSRNPIVPKKNARTSAALESPQEMCRRIHGDTPIGEAISSLLRRSTE